MPTRRTDPIVLKSPGTVFWTNEPSNADNSKRITWGLLTDSPVNEYYHRIEPHTRNSNYSQALSFEVYDPLWALARQWQFGRFEADDCGSAVKVKVKASRAALDKVEMGEKLSRFSPYEPLEYGVERRNVQITPYDRIESAKHYLKMLQNDLKTNSYGTRKTLADLIAKYPLDDFTKPVGSSAEPLEALKLAENDKLKKLWAVYGGRMFDGVKLYLDVRKTGGDGRFISYCSWFEEKYGNLQGEESGAWDEKKLGYDVSVYAGDAKYTAEDYGSGRLSWYSFDSYIGNPKPLTKEKFLSYLPTPATFKGAPNRRLWEFEDSKVQFGNFSNDEVSQLASAVMMQYAAQYGNDWMVIPLETEIGSIMAVDGIVVVDSFGEHIYIEKTPETNDHHYTSDTFADRWSLYTLACKDAYTRCYFDTHPCLLFPPTVLRAEESQALEEVQFLKDEMTNMIWAVENTIADGCGGTMDGRSFSDKVLTVVDEQKGEPAAPDANAEYSYLVQNRVPLNWIPFLPQRMEGEHREIVFRRGRMPIWYNEQYCSARPSTDLLAAKRGADGKVKPFYVYEEQVNGNGVKLVSTAQRTRWVGGRTFNWRGYSKKISGYQTNSGLMFDELLEVVKSERENVGKEE